jgi:branched-chain amino acid transport system ATP-binding protein
MTARLEVRGLTGGYPGLTVFSGVSFSVGSGELLTIVGANGSGKSALLETLQGLLPSRDGVITLDGDPVQNLPADVRAARGISLVSDRRRLWEEMSVQEHLRLGAFRAAARPGWRRRAVEIGEIFKALPSRRRALAARLSGGLQQQLALARLAMSCPRVWLLDDPLQGLDDATRGVALDWIQRAAKDGGAVVLTGQHIRSLLGVATRAMFLEAGSLRTIPAGEQGLADAAVQALL